MIKQILTQLWMQKKSNIWIFCELFLVAIFLWFIVDRAIVDIYTYTQPLGFDASHVYRIKTSLLEPGMPGYVEGRSKGDAACEDMFRLMDQLRLLPGVESVCNSYFSSFYSRGNSTSALARDTATVFPMERNVDVWRVTPGFFEVFKIKSENGEPINSSVFTSSGFILSKDMRDYLFGNENPVGQRVKLFDYKKDIKDIPTSTVLAVTTSIRRTEYRKAEPCFFQCLEGPALVGMVNDFGVDRGQIAIRISPQADHDFVNKFLAEMGERTTVNNLYVSSIVPLKEMRAEALEPVWKEEKTRLSLVAFVLINVFFGVVATFWLRTGYRRGEIGLRKALGANKQNIFNYLQLEGIILLLLTLIPVIIVVLNIVYGGYTDTERLDLSFWRLAGALLITYLILYLIIALGVWFPARRSASIDPATALHDE